MMITNAIAMYVVGYVLKNAFPKNGISLKNGILILWNTVVSSGVSAEPSKIIFTKKKVELAARMLMTTPLTT
ncbi:hypothetical protein D3C77_617030 [compost metagenome]